MAQVTVDLPVVYHIPVCPFSQRLQILLSLKGMSDAIDFHVVDITKPRPDWLLELTEGRTSLPVLRLPDGSVLQESLAILHRLEDLFPDPPIARFCENERTIEQGLIALEGPLVQAGYTLVMNQDKGRRMQLVENLLAEFGRIDDYLCTHSPVGFYLFDRFGLAEAVFTPIFQRFWFLEYYERFVLPAASRYGRIGRWITACTAHPAAQQVTREEIIKLYYDYALGAGNGALATGRNVSSFVFTPHWSERPWPPPDKYGCRASDDQLGLIAR